MIPKDLVLHGALAPISGRSLRRPAPVIASHTSQTSVVTAHHARHGVKGPSPPFERPRHGVKGPSPPVDGGKGPFTPLPGRPAHRNRPEICARARSEYQILMGFSEASGLGVVPGAGDLSPVAAGG